MYEATETSLRGHPVPAWFDDAKLGIFIHWGLFSIPGFAARLRNVSDAFSQHYPLSAVMTPYTEWYDNALRVPESPTARHHAESWPGLQYADFRKPFNQALERWDPVAWARLFKRAGAAYVVLVSKHHDGYCLWPSRVANPHRQDWCAERDIVGDLAEAVRAQGMRFGLYYSGGIDWSWNSTPVRTLLQFIGSVPRGAYPSYAEAQVRELIDRYRPSVLWNDISWPTGKTAMLRLMADYYNAVDDGVVNDRWMHYGLPLRLLGVPIVQRALDGLLARRIRRQVEKGEYAPGIVPPAPLHCDFRTPEYTSFRGIKRKKWEATRGMSPSFGYNRFDTEDDYEDPTELVRSFVDTVSKNGNLLLNVGPRGEDASIPEPQVRRLEILGGWLEDNGDAVLGTRPWTVAEGETLDGRPVRFTVRADTVFATVLGTSTSPDRLSFDLPGELPGDLVATRVADGAKVDVDRDGARIVLAPGVAADNPIGTAFALRRKSA